MLIFLKNFLKKNRLGLQELVGHSTPIFGATLVSGLTYILLLALISREVGLDGLGAYAALTTLVLIAEAFASLQSWQMMIYFGSKFLTTQDLERFRALRKLGLILDIFSSLSSYLLAFTAATVVNAIADRPIFSESIVLIAALPLLLPGASSGLGLLRLNEKSALIGYSLAAGPLLNLLVAVLAISFSAPNVLDFAAFWALGQFFTKLLLLLFSIQPKGIPLEGNRAKVSIRKLLSPEVGVVRFVFATAISSNLRAVMQFDLIVVSFIAGQAAAGLYAIAKSFERFGQRIISPFEQVLLPIFVRNQANPGDGSASDGTKLLSLGLGLIFTFLAFIVLLFGEEMLVFGFGEGSSEAYLPTLIFLIVVAARGFTVGLSDRLTANGHANWLMISSSLSGISLFGFLLVFAPNLGATGGALSFLGATVVHIALMLVKRPQKP